MEKIETFWTDEYPKKAFEEKAAYWAWTMYRQMRWQTEADLDIYDSYDSEWYQWALKREPDFDNLLRFIFKHYKDDFLYHDLSPEKILERIGKDKKDFL